MGRTATEISLTPEEEAVLRRMAEAASPRRIAERAHIVLLAAEGFGTQEIARALRIQAARVSKWRIRFATYGVAGLADTFRPGKPPSYDEATGRAILEMIAQPPPQGHRVWTAELLAQELGNVSKDQIWRTLRRQGVSLRRRRRWVVNTDPEFAARVADIAGMYLGGAENALVLAVDKLSATLFATGVLRLPGSAPASRFRRARRGGTTLRLASALALATQSVRAGQYRVSAHRGLTEFVREIAHDLPRHELHILLDGRPSAPATHAAPGPEIHWHAAVSHALWLSQVEFWCAMLGRKLGPGTASPRALREAMDRFITAARTGGSAPFEWRKVAAPGLEAVPAVSSTRT